MNFKKDNLPIGKSNISVFDNSKVTNKKIQKKITHSGRFEFNNDYIKQVISKKRRIVYSDVMSFDSYIFYYGNTLTYSTGVFQTNEYPSVVSGDYTYDDVNALVKNLSIDSYWFDNSVPSTNDYFQTLIKTTASTDDALQFSVGFPKYTNNLEVDIGPINKQYPLDIEGHIYPKTPSDEELNLEMDYISGVDYLNIQFTLGKEYFNNLNLEVAAGMDGQWVKSLNMEFTGIKFDSYNTNIEFSKIFKDDYNLNLEVNATELGYYYRTDLEFEVVYEGFTDTNLEVQQGPGSAISLEFLIYLDTDYDFNIEFQRIYHTNYNLNLEVERIYNDEYPLNIETYVNELSKDYNINIETYVQTVNKILNIEVERIYNDREIIDVEVDIPTINTTDILNIEAGVPDLNKIYPLDIEVERVYKDEYDLNLEVDLPYLNTVDSVDMEISTYTFNNVPLDIEFIRAVDIQNFNQAFIIPFGYEENIFQVGLRSLVIDATNIEVNVEDILTEYNFNLQSDILINKEYNVNIETVIPYISKDVNLDIETDIYGINTESELNIEVERIYNDTYDLNIEMDNVINTEDTLNLEVGLPGVNHIYDLNLEAYTMVPINKDLNLEVQTVINMDYNLDFEFFVDGLQKDYNLNIETFVDTVNRDFNIEFFVETVPKTLHLEFDVLDLVYYVLKSGYNIVPWTYSDGLGKWDVNSNKNWDKEDKNNTTFKTGLLNQLESKGLQIPSNITFSDKFQDNFGVILPGYMDDYNLTDSFLYYETTEDYTLVLGKKKKDSYEKIDLKMGINMVIWDGNEDENSTFNKQILPFIENDLDYVMVWKQAEGTWETLLGKDHNLLFDYEIDSEKHSMPYIFIIKVLNDTFFEIRR